MASITAFRVGHCTHPSCMVLKGSGLASRCFPSRAYLIDTRAGLYLWDTGYAEHFRAATSKGVYRMYAWVTPIFFDENESLQGQLRAHGVAPGDIHTLLLSHFHADHIAGLRDFPGARLMASKTGWDAVRGLSGVAAVRQAFVPELLPADMSDRLAFVESVPETALPAALLPFTHGRDVSGTGEIYIVDLPGHAIGHLGAFVLQEGGWTLLASDAAWVPESFQQLRGPSELSFIIQHKRAPYYATLNRLHQLHRRAMRRSASRMKIRSIICRGGPSVKRIFWLLLSYWRTRRLRFADRAQLDAYQQRQLARFIDVLCARSSYFAAIPPPASGAVANDEQGADARAFRCHEHAGVTLAQAMEAAMAAEHSRDFTPAVGDITVGLSSGTSSRRAVFTVSPREKAQWAGVMLAKALPDGLFSGERVALFLRANSNLYTAVRSPWLTFAFYDLFEPFDCLCAQLAQYRPSVIVAPAQVLRQLALRVIDGSLALAPKKVISVAEVLEAQDRALIVQAFGAVHEIYQATEGFLASSCEHGVLHLNEEYVHIEPQWLDAGATALRARDYGLHAHHAAHRALPPGRHPARARHAVPVRPRHARHRWHRRALRRYAVLAILAIGERRRTGRRVCRRIDAGLRASLAAGRRLPPGAVG